MKIVIIGAGVAGLAIGWRLAESGQEVTVLERAQPGAGATRTSPPPSLRTRGDRCSTAPRWPSG